MTEKPILFSGEMVRAILDGRKTQTRRIIKPQPLFALCKTIPVMTSDNDPDVAIRCPYGKPGGRLWVREKWRIDAWREYDQSIAVDYCDGPDKSWRKLPRTMEGAELFDRLWIQSSEECRSKGIPLNGDGYRWEPGTSPLRWRPSIHMPRWASRINLEITKVRVERLQDISETDAIAEGVERTVTGDGWRNYHDDPEQEAAGLVPMPSAKSSFKTLWESINGPGSWDANPLVWVIEFRRVE